MAKQITFSRLPVYLVAVFFKELLEDHWEDKLLVPSVLLPQLGHHRLFAVVGGVSLDN